MFVAMKRGNGLGQSIFRDREYISAEVGDEPSLLIDNRSVQNHLFHLLLKDENPIRVAARRGCVAAPDGIGADRSRRRC
jgi:hypothetical protein